MGIAGLAVSILSLLGCCTVPFVGVLVAIVGAVLGGLGEKQVREQGKTGMGIAKAGRYTGIISAILNAILAVATIIWGAQILQWAEEQADVQNQTTVEQVEPADDIDVEIEPVE